MTSKQHRCQSDGAPDHDALAAREEFVRGARIGVIVRLREEFFVALGFHATKAVGPNAGAAARSSNPKAASMPAGGATGVRERERSA